MLSKIWVSAVLLSALCSLQATAHAVVSPALGVTGTPVRSDAQRPNSASPCGPDVTNITSAMESATVVHADSTGSFQVNATSFNGGVDGSLQFKGQVDASGTGTKFVPMNIPTNGNNSPAGVGSQMLVASLPAGTKCTGGLTGNLCLAQFISGGKFGNCVAVSQDTADAGTPTTAGDPTATTDTPTAAGVGHCPSKSTASTAATGGYVTARAGSLMARSLLANLGGIERAVEVAK